MYITQEFWIGVYAGILVTNYYIGMKPAFKELINRFKSWV